MTAATNLYMSLGEGATNHLLVLTEGDCDQGIVTFSLARPTNIEKVPLLIHNARSKNAVFEIPSLYIISSFYSSFSYTLTYVR